jgi:hypothetical protein
LILGSGGGAGGSSIVAASCMRIMDRDGVGAIGATKEVAERESIMDIVCVERKCLGKWSQWEDSLPGRFPRKGG